MRQNAHLVNGDFIKPLQSLGLRDAVIDHHCVDILHIGDANKLVGRARRWRVSDSAVFSKPLESKGFELWVVQLFPKAKILYRHAIAHPVAYCLLWVIRFKLRHVCKTNEVFTINFDDTNKHAPYIKLAGLFHCFTPLSWHAVEVHDEIDVAVGALLLAGTRAEDPKLFGLVLSSDGVYLVAPRPYLVKHTHILFLSRRIAVL